MIGKCLSKDQFGVVRLLLGRVLDFDLDSSVLVFSLVHAHMNILAYIDIGELCDFTSHEVPCWLLVCSHLPRKCG